MPQIRISTAPSNPRVQSLVQSLIAAEVDHFFSEAAGVRRSSRPNRVLCLSPHRTVAQVHASPPLLPAPGWVATRHIVGWAHGLTSEPSRPRFVEQLATLHTAFDDMDTVHAMLGHSARLGWRSVCVLGGEAFMQRARLAALALGLQVEQALAPA